MRMADISEAPGKRKTFDEPGGTPHDDFGISRVML
jgi:hypothetical protein